ncbi:MAG TPA: dodecin [Novosphingobium sp.]|nr:dodecin [Novosphingobium sp.]
MTDHVYKIVEIVGTSREGHDQAIKNGLKRATDSIRNVRWFEVTAQRGYVLSDDEIVHQVTLKIGFTLDED